MHWEWIGQATGVVAAIVAVVGFLAKLEVTPARYWAWRLRKQTETVKALDDIYHLKAQRQVLLRPVDRLANKAVAAQRIPTPWKRYATVAAIWVYAGQALVNSTRNLININGELRPGHWAGIALGMVALLGFLLLGYHNIVDYYLHTSRERRRFIAEGCPANFVPELGRYERLRADRRNARQMKKARALEPDGIAPQPRIGLPLLLKQLVVSASVRKKSARALKRPDAYQR